MKTFEWHRKSLLLQNLKFWSLPLRKRIFSHVKGTSVEEIAVFVFRTEHGGIQGRSKGQ